ncbi:nucleotide-binding protein [Candidatus Woesearchaeota archaeon]|nr:nucleotide-binding protein [Candidatus Woesearchaeota archaeon]
MTDRHTAGRQKVILDTNFLLIPGQFKVDIFSEIDRIMPGKYDLCVIDRTLDELEGIINSGEASGADKAAAKLAKALIKAKQIPALKTEKNLNVDNLIKKQALQGGYIVATQDRALKSALKEKNIPLIVLRQKKHLKLL